MCKAPTTWLWYARASSSTIMHRARCRDEAPRRPCEEVDENALVEEQCEHAEGAVPSQLRSVVSTASHSRHLIGGPRSQEICTVQTGGHSAPPRKTAACVQGQVFITCASTPSKQQLMTAHHNGDEHHQRAAAHSKAPLQLGAAWSRPATTSQRLALEPLFTPELKDQLGLDLATQQQIADRHCTARDALRAVTVGELRCRAHVGVQVVLRTWAGNRERHHIRRGAVRLQQR